MISWEPASPTWISQPVSVAFECRSQALVSTFSVLYSKLQTPWF